MLKVISYVKLDNETVKQIQLVKNLKKWLLYRPANWQKNRAESITNLTIRVDRNLTVWVNMVWSDNLNANFTYSSLQIFQAKFLEWFSHNTDIEFTFISPMSDDYAYKKTLNMAKYHALSRYTAKKPYKETYLNDLKLFADIHDFVSSSDKLKKMVSQ